MKKLFLTTLLLVTGLGAQADGRRWHGHHSYGHGSPRVSFYWGGGHPRCSPWNSYSSSYYPGYGYGYDYTYSRPNYAVNGTLTGALLGGIIGNSIHHQGWEGAGIGAAAGLLLGSVAERNARADERSYTATPAVSYSYSQPAAIANAPTVNTAPGIPDAPTAPSAPAYKPARAMSSANSLFGR